MLPLGHVYSSSIHSTNISEHLFCSSLLGTRIKHWVIRSGLQPHEVYSRNGPDPINYLKSVFFLCQHTQKRGITSCSSILIPNKLSNPIRQLSHSCDIEFLVWIMFEGHGVFKYMILATRGRSYLKNISREEEKGQTHSMKGCP